jgi:pentose-5-phosphate-3-epimerase
MIEILPALMPKNIGDIRGKLSFLFERTDMVQLDIMDGVYVPDVTWPYNGEDQQFLQDILDENDGLPFWDQVSFEFDLMIKNASAEMDMFIKLGATRIVFHPDGEDDPDALFERLEALDPYIRDHTKIGIALRVNEPFANIERFIPLVDYVQCMGIETIGLQGEPFDPRTVEQIKEIKSRYPDMIVSVDGGMTIETAHQVLDAGADRLVVGSAIWKSIDPEETLRDFQHLAR